MAGAVSMIFFTYAFVNMGMVGGILPVVGVAAAVCQLWRNGHGHAGAGAGHSDVHRARAAALRRKPGRWSDPAPQGDRVFEQVLESPDDPSLPSAAAQSAPTVQRIDIARQLLLAPLAWMKATLARAGRDSRPWVDDADLYFQYTTARAGAWREGIVKTGSFSIDQGVGVRAVSGEDGLCLFRRHLRRPPCWMRRTVRSISAARQMGGKARLAKDSKKPQAVWESTHCVAGQRGQRWPCWRRQSSWHAPRTRVARSWPGWPANMTWCWWPGPTGPWLRMCGPGAFVHHRDRQTGRAP